MVIEPQPRAVATPNLIVTDSGLGGRLIGMSEERAQDPVAPVGPVLENFAIGEVARQLSWAEEPVQLFHHRDRDQVEVDMVLEHAAGTVIGIGVKAAETARGEDFRGCATWRNRLGDRFRPGIVLYAGEQQLSFGDRLTPYQWPPCGRSTAAPDYGSMICRGYGGRRRPAGPGWERREAGWSPAGGIRPGRDVGRAAHEFRPVTKAVNLIGLKSVRPRGPGGP